MSNIRCGSCAKLYTCLITDALLCLNNNNMLYKNKNFIELEEELPKYVISYGDFYYIKESMEKTLSHYTKNTQPLTATVIQLIMWQKN